MLLLVALIFQTPEVFSEESKEMNLDPKSIQKTSPCSHVPNLPYSGFLS